MSVLLNKLLEDQQAAMRAGDQVRLAPIRMLRAALLNAAIAKNGELTDAEIANVTAREARQRRELIEEAKKAGRSEIVQKEEAQLAVVLGYMPEQLSPEQVAAEVQKVIAEVGARGPADRGRVMGKLMPAVKGKADGKLVASLVEQQLNNLGK